MRRSVNVAVTTDPRARLPVIAWDAPNVPTGTNVPVWLTDYAGKFSMSRSTSGRSFSRGPRQQSGWIGRVTRIGLAIRGSSRNPSRYPASRQAFGVVGVLQDRVREWLHSSDGRASINVGRRRRQVAAAFACRGNAPRSYHAARRFRPVGAPMWRALAIMFAASWFVLDARWTWNLARQAQATIAQYGGKDWRGAPPPPTGVVRVCRKGARRDAGDAGAHIGRGRNDYIAARGISPLSSQCLRGVHKRPSHTRPSQAGGLDACVSAARRTI